MNTRAHVLKTWVGSMLAFAPLFVAFGGVPGDIRPDTTLLDDRVRRTRLEFRDLGTRGSNRVVELRARPTIISLVTNPPAGVGFVLEQAADGAVVQRVLENTPARRAGVIEGDLIVAIDGRPTAGVPLYRLWGQLIGKAGSTVDLTVSRTGHVQELKVRLRREVIQPPQGGSTQK